MALRNLAFSSSVASAPGTLIRVDSSLRCSTVSLTRSSGPVKREAMSLAAASSRVLTQSLYCEDQAVRSKDGAGAGLPPSLGAGAGLGAGLGSAPPPPP